MTVFNKAEGAFHMLLKSVRSGGGDQQKLDVYSEQSFSDVLENWAVDSAWPEIQFLLSGRSGKTLDLACGSGRAHDFLKNQRSIAYYGCDIAKPLIERAVERGIPASNLMLGDATKLTYANDEFDYLFSIGSLEHFTVKGLESTLLECKRVCSGMNFHMVPVSKSGFNEGWVNAVQSYWNNSEAWWLQRFRAAFGEKVWTMPSRWQDRRSRGVWFMCLAAERKI
jgi:ubiquinone/menaquinone biosynthesis C-methylase UbiE